MGLFFSKDAWREVTGYQWMVLAIASAGWVFDVFEGQIFVSVKDRMLQEVVAPLAQESPRELADRRDFVFNIGLAAFLAGGALGGVAFGMLADRWGRRRVMAVTILMYSLFTGLMALAESAWQIAVLRFLVGMGVGGEWAVAAAVVAEVFPPRARVGAAGIFHASSVLGTCLAIAVALIVLNWESGWRWAFVTGLLPALLVAWIRLSMREPENWQAAREAARRAPSQRLGRFTDLFSTPTLRKHTLLGLGLGIIGLATFWGTHIRGQDVLKHAVELEDRQADEPRDADRYRLLGMLLTTLGGGVGLLSFAPISQGIGRRPAFALFHLGGFVLVLVVYLLANSATALIIVLPVFGFFTLGMHAGYAVYFPELFPTRLRGTGAGFCFNAARIIAGPVLLGFAMLRGAVGGLAPAMLVLASLFLIGLPLITLAPETRGQPLPE